MSHGETIYVKRQLGNKWEEFIWYRILGPAEFNGAIVCNGRRQTASEERFLCTQNY